VTYIGRMDPFQTHDCEVRYALRTVPFSCLVPTGSYVLTCTFSRYMDDANPSIAPARIRKLF
jgi:hypothetical protein